MHSQSLDFHRQETDGKLTFLTLFPGIFASYYYPLGVLLLIMLGQFIALWLLLVAALCAHGFRYPRIYGVFYPFYFWSTALGILVLPVCALVLTLATGVSVSSP